MDRRISESIAMVSSKRHLPCPAFRCWPDSLYYYWIENRQNQFLLLDELANKINRDRVNSLYFIDNTDNCVPVGLWRLNNEIYMNGFDVDTFRNLSAPGDWIGLKMK
ncbi:hypothetical protein PIB30_004760 [Stylosanthes scabra]|uniref:Uncharacterized protein n=1 Tax=Stylosanthes scabra TaxID=79078 RepID=A0ABU6T4G5_9FABA|nr:hypothetical protein [Stylosanthes scabra]